ncbi:MAG TPA: DUF3592 domain-containing protein [Anaerolineae bacterium]|nr:DUF3592 domain-containing protein [Anaerolineae bacterium]
MTLQFTVLALIILGFFHIAATLWSLVNAEASRSWPSTLGTIALSRTLEEHAQSHYGKGITYIPQISYTYGVGDRDYKGDRISFGMPGWKSKAKALAWVDQHRVGETVKVYYDPAEPGNSVLETHARGSWGNALVGLVCWIFAALILAIRPR